MDRVGIVTGGGSGIGRAIGLGLARAGWCVVLAGRRRHSLEAVCREGEAELGAGMLIGIVADVCDEELVRALFAQTLAQFGRVDLLFNNAGALPDATPFTEVGLADFNAMMAVNVTGAFLCAREAFRIMADQSPRGGRIINNGSLSAQVPRPLSTPYTVSKHAITGLTRAVALEGRAFDIACGQIDIGNCATDMTAGPLKGAMQANGAMAPEAAMDVADVARLVALAELPVSASVPVLTVIATGMPFIGRG